MWPDLEKPTFWHIDWSDIIIHRKKKLWLWSIIARNYINCGIQMCKRLIWKIFIFKFSKIYLCPKGTFSKIQSHIIPIYCFAVTLYTQHCDCFIRVINCSIKVSGSFMLKRMGKGMCPLPFTGSASAFPLSPHILVHEFITVITMGSLFTVANNHIQ